MQKLMISLSHGGTIKLINNMSSSFDEDVLVWSAGQEAHFRVLFYQLTYKFNDCLGPITEK